MRQKRQIEFFCEELVEKASTLTEKNKKKYYVRMECSEIGFEEAEVAVSGLRSRPLADISTSSVEALDSTTRQFVCYVTFHRTCRSPHS